MPPYVMGGSVFMIAHNMQTRSVPTKKVNPPSVMMMVQANDPMAAPGGNCVEECATA
jgi:hypothetical protein